MTPRDRTLREYLRSFGLEDDMSPEARQTCLEHSGVCARVEELARRCGELEEASATNAAALSAAVAQIADLRAQVRPWSGALASALGSLLTAALAFAAAKGGLL